MSHNPHKCILFGRDITQLPQDQNQQGGGGGGGHVQGCCSTPMELPTTKEKEKINVHEGCCSSSALMENLMKYKRKRLEDDHDHDHHDQQSDVSSSNVTPNTKNNGHNMTTKKLILSNEVVVHNPNVVAVAPGDFKLVIESSSSSTTTTTTSAQQLLLQQQQHMQQQMINIRLIAWRHYGPEEEEEERRRGVSTRLELYSDPWKVKKTLTMSDIRDTQSRVLIHANLVETHIKPFMVRAGFFDQVLTSEGVRFSVWDVDTNTIHTLVFKRSRSMGSFIFINNWCWKFVHRRRLNVGDEVGFLWDPYSSRFLFRVLNRAPNP